MIEIRIRRPCREPEPNVAGPFGIEGVECPDCGKQSRRRDRRIDHDAIEEWITLEEFKELLKGAA